MARLCTVKVHITNLLVQMIFYEKISVSFMEPSLFALLLFHIKSLLSVPFYDIISANNVETEHENEDSEFDEAQNVIHDSESIGSNGKKSQNGNELNILRSGHSFDAIQGQDSSYGNGKENSESGDNNGEGELIAHF